MKESKTVLHAKVVIDGVEQEVLIMPITRLDCVEDTAELLNTAAAGDHIPIMDASDNGQMKKISVENLIPSGNELAKNHNHDDRYYTETEVDGKLAEKANSSHTHAKSEITDFPTSLPANGGNAATVGGAAVITTSTLGLHRMASGSAAPTSTTCPPGCWYGQYE